MEKFRRRYIGDKAFYKLVFTIVFPIIIQNTVASFVNLLDNVMVGRIGTEQMSGVAIANQLLFVFNLCIFGGLSGAGIFTAQFQGANDDEGVRYTFRFKIYTALFVLLVAYVAFSVAGPQLISLFLTEDASGDLQATLSYGTEYLHILYLGIAPFALSQCYAGTLRETGETMLPMKASLAEVLTNLFLNYLLIYGKLGFPELGVRGAAIATVISRYVGLCILVVYTHTHTAKHPFIVGAYRSLHIPLHLTWDIIRKGMPLLLNEALWSFGTSFTTQQYSLRGMAVVAALNISSTLSNMFNILFMSLGNSIAILVGQSLGAGDVEEAKGRMRKLTFCSLAVCLLCGTLLAVFAPELPKVYNTSETVHSLATSFLLVSACMMPIYAFVHCTYFTLRSGGKTVITSLYDCGFTWLVVIPTAHLLISKTALGIIPVYAICQGTEAIKAIVGYILVKKGVWIHNIVQNDK